MKNFQIVILVIFGGLAVFGVLVFSGAVQIGQEKAGEGSLGSVTMWGTVPQTRMNPIVGNFNENNRSIDLDYEYIDPSFFDQSLLEALASGTGPDLFLISNELAYKYGNKIYIVPYESYPFATFRDYFASATEVFATSHGILAFPIGIDPMMMYYNRSILEANNIVYPPETWQEFLEVIPKVTRIDNDRRILKGGVGMGQFDNVNHAKYIISMLFMQSGNPIVEETETSGFRSTLVGGRSSGLGNALSFYTNFANPLSSVYTWNRSLPNSREFFSAENSAFYFGFASELESLVNSNPNQNLAVAPVPQIEGANFKLTSARVMGIGVSAFSRNRSTAITTANIMSSSSFASSFANASGWVPARKDLLNIQRTDAFYPTFYASALYARSWLDPSPQGTNNVFRIMVDSVLSNTAVPQTAVLEGANRFNLLF